MCLSNSPDRRGACLTSVPPYGGHRNGSPGNLVAGGGVAGLALRGSEERMEVRMSINPRALFGAAGEVTSLFVGKSLETPGA